MNDKELCKKCIYYDDFCCRNNNAICVNNSEYTETEMIINIINQKIREPKTKIVLTPYDLGAAFCTFNLRCYSPCVECAAFINGFCGGGEKPTPAELKKIGEEILKEWKGGDCEK